jgi:hypothetical protein
MSYPGRDPTFLYRLISISVWLGHEAKLRQVEQGRVTNFDQISANSILKVILYLQFENR